MVNVFFNYFQVEMGNFLVSIVFLYHWHIVLVILHILKALLYSKLTYQVCH